MFVTDMKGKIVRYQIQTRCAACIAKEESVSVMRTRTRAGICVVGNTGASTVAAAMSFGTNVSEGS
jgi:hypothetical protein